ncbi:MAG: hypothetical protein WC838_05005, partial [Candidatus Margulisiibacteriota bacterium]
AKLDKEKLTATVIDTLLERNEDFRESYKNNKDSCAPLVSIYRQGEGPFSSQTATVKNVYLNKPVKVR